MSGDAPLDIGWNDDFDPVGLCRTCRHARRVTSARGSKFYLCRRSESDPRFPKYPQLPVLRCAGFETTDGDERE